MMALRYRKRRDANEPEVAAALRRLGAKVYQLDGKAGIPDLLVGYRGQTYLIEVKVPGQVRKRLGPTKAARYGNLDPDQHAFHSGWCGGPCVVVESVEDAIRAVGGA